MSSDLMTSTMKSEPGRACSVEYGGTFGTSVSTAATCSFGGSTEGTRGGACPVALGAASAGLTALPAPATAAAARNLRRSSFGVESFLLMLVSLAILFLVRQGARFGATAGA